MPVAIAACSALFLHSAYRTWSLVNEPHTASLTPGKSENAVPAGTPFAPRSAVRHILDAHLFNDTSMAEANHALSSIDLRGTFAGSGNTPSYAIIAESGQPEKSYRVGDQLASGAEVTAIFADRVTIRNNGADRTVYLRKEH